MNETEIRTLAKKIAPRVRKPTDSIKLPKQEEISISDVASREVTSGFWIFKKTEIERYTTTRTGSKVKYYNYPIDGWILYTFFEYCDSIQGPRGHADKHKETSKYFYVLKCNGDLSVYEIGFTVEFLGTDHERLIMRRELKEHELTFEKPGLYSNGSPRICDLIYKHSGFALDYKPVKWESKHRRSGIEVDYFTRNIPFYTGTLGSNGESSQDSSPMKGLERRLKKLVYSKKEEK